MGLALGTNLKFYTSVAKGLKLKVRKFWGLIPTFVEVAGEKLVGGESFLPHILNRLKFSMLPGKEKVSLYNFEHNKAAYLSCRMKCSFGLNGS